MISNKFRTHICSEIDAKLAGKNIKLAGWVRKKRDHGPIIFIDLVDASGCVQCIIQKDEKPPTGKNIFNICENLSHESVVTISGVVKMRSAQTVNKKISSGEIELEITDIEVLTAAQELPFAIYQENLSEELQLKYRFLYLRRKEIQEMLVLRTRVIDLLRQYMKELGFLEIQTPILASSSPEGARDYIVPSRLHPGKFYALPQAPQQFKQLLMASGIERYFQIAPCFRDEDSRADRLVGEFYQLDFEMAFAQQEDVFSVLEHVLYNVFHTIRPECKIDKKFKRIPYKIAIEKYGSDKPDLRIPLEIQDITNLQTPNIFKELVINGGKLLVISANIENPSSQLFEQLTKDMLQHGAKGLAYCIMKDEKWSGPLNNMFSNEIKEEILHNKDNINGGNSKHNAIFLIADKKDNAYKLAGQLRSILGKKLDLIAENVYAFCLITDFPMFEWNEKKSGENKWDFMHNPFSMPQNLDAPINEILSYQYDIVCNGYELSSGAVRNYSLDVVKRVFEIIGDDCINLEERFPLYKSFRYGIPPHAGSAPGIDRIIMLLSGKHNVRDIVPFPLNQNGENLLMHAPCFVHEELLKELKIKIIE